MTISATISTNGTAKPAAMSAAVRRIVGEGCGAAGRYGAEPADMPRNGYRTLKNDR